MGVRSGGLAFRLTGMLARYHYVILLCPKKSEALLALPLLLLLNHKRGSARKHWSVWRGERLPPRLKWGLPTV
ncbi:hypothetical protein BJ166DRAFT_187531 [Pestalotiopsis sp. NC0098]|nr:hypothetical protein BJ166DRAFT_187531 [Pestalotiopsis sp. NC0098]